MAGAGFAPESIDRMAMADVLTLLRYWREHPPTHEILAAAYGITPAARANPADPSNIGELIARHPDGRVGH